MKSCKHCHQSIADDALFCLHCGKSQVEADEGSLIGKVVAQRYLIREKIGGGGSGTVYLARHVTLQKKMAVKVLHHHLCTDDAAVERFRREATTMAQIENEHIIAVQDFGRADDGRLYLAMELLEGRPLADLLAETSPLPVPRALAIFNQIVDALTEAHDQGYVHRDLRPANLFLTEKRGKADFVKVMDFGLSKLILNELEPGQVTVGMNFGDPRYLSPEQAAGESVDRRTDIYSIGVVLYEMLCGVPPFVGDDVFAVINQHLRVKPTPPSRVNPRLASGFDDVVLRALAKKRQDRWPTAAEMSDVLATVSMSATMPGLGAHPSTPPRQDETQPAVPRAMSAAPSAPVSAPAPEASPAGTAAPAEAPAPEASPAGTAPPAEAPAAPAVVQPAPAPGLQHPPERPDGSGPHAIPPALMDRPDGAPPLPPTSASPEAAAADEAPDPTMSQMWYADGEAEAEEAIQDYEKYQARQGRHDPDVTDPVIPGVASEATLFMRLKRARRVMVLTIAVVAVTIAATVILISRNKGAVDEPPPPQQQQSAAAREMQAGSMGATTDADGGARQGPDAGGKPLSVVDMAVRIDVNDPTSGMTGGMTGGHRRRPPPHSGMGMRPRSRLDAGVSRSTDAAKAVIAGRRALSRGDVAAARIEFQRALSSRPGYGPALAGLGAALFEQGRYASAIKRLRAATRSMPRSVRTWVLLGNACFRAGRYSSARGAYQRALSLRPGHAEAKRNLALVLKKLGTSGM